MSTLSRRAKELKSMGDHDHFLKRIQKTLYYGKLPATDRLSLPVTELASELFSEPRTGRSLDRLHCKDAAYISREACISPCSLVLAMLYLERLKSYNPDYLQNVAPSQLFLVSLMVSSKFLYDDEDSGVIMSEWAESGGITLNELIALEREFLSSIQWDIFVKDAAFWQRFDALEESLARRESKVRGYFTYTELHTLMRTFDAYSVVNAMATIMGVLLATYTAGVLTIFGSMCIASQIPGHSLSQPQTTTSSSAAAPMQNDTPPEMFDESRRSPFAVDVLQTGILLASIQSSQPPQQDREFITWDWWNNTSMTWLAHASELATTLRDCIATTRLTPDDFLDVSISNAKRLATVDKKVHRRTKMRKQDLLESSWHTEWTDTIGGYFPYKHITRFFQEVKA